ncbi:sulfotransferase [Idiomarina abyssalis]|uniref:sulfotransferase family protein n=1 Tax=Idiomarina abyssalis TaxID=86102 RepID=UPI002301EE93|nr:sulfotransferase [Idiomarina abyssalis]MDA6067154.1 sulfotransferase [Idiomarina abyssalis]
MNFTNKPIFIIASERSGTNLLRKRLTDSQDFYYGPSPAHFLKNMYFQEPYYGNLDNNSNFKLFIQQALDLCLVHFAPWSVDWNASTLLGEYGNRRRDSISLMHFLMTKYAQEKGFQSYICKDNYLYEFALEIEKSIPDAFFIYLYRDPRDFCLSQIKRPGSLKSVGSFAKLWAYEQTKAIKVSYELNRRSKCFDVSYEELIQNESEVIERLLKFLGITRGSSRKTEDDVKVNVHDWANLNKPTISDNSGKFLRELSMRQVKIIESRCRQQMKFLNYETCVAPGGEMSKVNLFVDMLKGYILQAFEKKGKANLEEANIRGKRNEVLNKCRVNYRSDR